MPNIEALIRTIVEPLILHPNDLTIKQIESDDFFEYHLYLNPDDIGRVIGKKGRVARAIRTIIYSVRVKGPKRVRLVIADEATTIEE